MKEIQQAEIYLANLDPVKGHEQGGYRPILILQNNHLNKHLNTVVIAPITKNLRYKGYLTTFFIEKKKSKLKFDSVALLYQVRTIDKKRLKKAVCQLDAVLFSAIKRQLSLVF